MCVSHAAEVLRSHAGRDAIGIMEKGNYCSILGLYRDSGKENGNYCSILGVYRDNGKENGNYHSILGVYRDNGK